MAKKKQPREILVNRIFNGDYAKDPNTIAHENINILKADDGKHYIYIVDTGSIAKTHNDRIEYVLLTRSNGDGRIEIIGKVFGNLKQLVKVKTTLNKELESIGAAQKELAKSIKYSAKSIADIIKDNNYSPAYDEYPIYATFVADKMLRPSRPLYIANSQDGFSETEENILINSKLAKRSQKQYFKEGTQDYQTLLKAINDNGLWEEEDNTPNLSVDTLNDHYLTIIRKENDEVIYSNLLKHYFLEDKNAFKGFLKDELEIDVSNDFKIDREVQTENGKFIDLLIQDKDNLIVIENKIKSKINGVRHDIYSDYVQSQLSDYYNFANSKANGRAMYFFILSPNYNKIDLSRFLQGDKYHLIHYSQLYEYYKGVAQTNSKFKEFIYPLEIQSTTSDQSVQREIVRRFVDKVKSLT